MKSRRTQAKKGVMQGPSQRQLRAGELIRHALVEVMRVEELQDENMQGISVTITQVRLSPDLRNAMVFIEPLGGGDKADVVVKSLNRHAKFLRGRLGSGIETKFTPELRFMRDESFDEAARMARLFDNPKVRRDLDQPVTEAGETDDADHGA